MKNINENAIAREAVVLIQDNELLFLMKGDIVNITTDGTEFKKKYKEVKIDPTADALFFEGNVIRYEYIEEIEFISRNIEY